MALTTIQRTTLAALLLVYSNAFALTPAQLQTLKAAIDADPALSSQPMNSDGAFAIADAMNQPASPAFVVWRTSVMQDEITRQAGFTWTLVDSLSVGSARIWEWMFDNVAQSINCGALNVRQGIADVWSGSAPKLAVQTVVLTTCKRASNRAEKIFATGTGSDATPATLTREGAISYQDVEQARAL